MTRYIVVFVLSSLILLIGGARRFAGQALYVLAQALIWLTQQIIGRTPGWMAIVLAALNTVRTNATGRIVTALTWLGWILAIFVVAIAAGIVWGKPLALAVIALVLGTIAYLAFRTANVFGGTWGARTALMLYGLAVLGFLFPDAGPIESKYAVAGLILLAMFNILRRLSGQVRAGAGGALVPTRTAIWSGRAMRALIALIIVSATAAFAATQIGWLDLRVGRAAFTNRVLNNQAESETRFHEQAQAALDATAREIHEKLGNELNSGSPNPSAADAAIARLEAQKAVVAKGQKVNPAVAAGPKIRLPRFNEEMQAMLLVGLATLAIGAWLMARIFSGGGSSAAHH